MSTASEAPPEPEADEIFEEIVIEETTTTKVKTKKGIWKRTKDLVATFGTKVKSGAKKVWSATKTAAKHSWAATKWVGWVVTVGVGWLGTILFSAIGFLVEVVATVVTAIAFGILILLGIILAVIVFAFMSVGFFYNKYVLGLFRYFKSRGNKEAREEYPTMKAWYEFNSWFKGQTSYNGTYEDFASHWWGRFLNDEGDIVVPESEEKVEEPEEELPDMSRWRPGDGWPFKLVNKADKDFEEQIDLMIEEDLADPKHAFPDAEVQEIDESEKTYDIIPLGYFPEIEGDSREWDYSVYDDLDQLLELYAYHMSRAEHRKNVQRYHYWEGRIRMLMSYKTDPDRLDRSGMVWALIHNQLKGQRSHRAMWYVRAGFKDEVESLMRREQRLSTLAEAR